MVSPAFFHQVDSSQPIQSVEDFVGRVRRLIGRNDNLVAYRGHGDLNFGLVPSLFRDSGHKKHEREMMQMVVAAHSEAFASDITTFEKLVRLQHFAVPTRLLDITWNPLVALYFCASSHLDRDGHVVFIAPYHSRTKFYDSDSVSCLANLAYLDESERNDIITQVAVPSHNRITEEDFNHLFPVRKLVGVVRREKPYFEARIKPEKLISQFIVHPKLSNRRILAQNGAFVIFGLHGSFATTPPLRHFTTTAIPVRSEHKKEILRQLDQLGLNESSMFPELESAGRHISAKFRASKQG